MCSVGCEKCNKVASEEYIKRGQELMLSLPTKYEFSDNQEEVLCLLSMFEANNVRSQITKLRNLIDQCRAILHPENIYLCRMITAYMQMAPDDNAVANIDMHKLVYANYKRCTSLCYVSC